MSKQIQKVRISQLAKDLGVDWKDIKAKCESEGIDQAKTASSTVSIGLAETIREWFSGAGGTAVETAAKVDPRAKGADAEGGADAPKKPARRTAKKAAEPAAEAVAPGAEAVAEAAPAAERVEPVAKAVAPAPEPVPAPAPVPVVEVPELDLAPRLPTEDISVVTSPESVAPHTVVDAPVSPSVIGKAHKSTRLVEAIVPAAPAPAPVRPAPSLITKPPVRHTIQPAAAPPTMNVPKRPEVVRAVGQALTPTKSALSGPKVIRVEQPEVLPTPRPRTFSGPGAPGGPRFGGAGAGMRGGHRPNTPSSRTGRAGEGRGRDFGGARTGDPGTTDINERERRLAQSAGWMKSRRKGPGSGGGPGGGARFERRHLVSIRLQRREQHEARRDAEHETDHEAACRRVVIESEPRGERRIRERLHDAAHRSVDHPLSDRERDRQQREARELRDHRDDREHAEVGVADQRQEEQRQDQSWRLQETAAEVGRKEEPRHEAEHAGEHGCSENLAARSLPAQELRDLADNHGSGDYRRGGAQEARRCGLPRARSGAGVAAGRGDRLGGARRALGRRRCSLCVLRPRRVLLQPRQQQVHLVTQLSQVVALAQLHAEREVAAADAFEALADPIRGARDRVRQPQRMHHKQASRDQLERHHQPDQRHQVRQFLIQRARFLEHVGAVEAGEHRDARERSGWDRRHAEHDAPLHRRVDQPLCAAFSIRCCHRRVGPLDRDVIGRDPLRS